MPRQQYHPNRLWKPLQCFRPNHPGLSPDGARFALIRGINGRPAIAVYEVDAPKEPGYVIASPWIATGLRWAKNDVLITYYGGLVVAQTLDNGPTIHLRSFAQIDDVDLDSRDTIFANYGGALFRVNVRDGSHSPVDSIPRPEEATASLG